MLNNTQDLAARKQAWHVALDELQRMPLTYCPSFPDTARRWQAWWRFQADRPLIVAAAVKNPTLRWDKAFDLLDQPEAWVRLRGAQVAHTHYAGEALPFARVDIGPVALAAFMGAPLRLALREQTSWQAPMITSWADCPRLEAPGDNPWLVKVLTLMKALAEDARGRYLVCLPDLTGAVDALANLRGPERLCVDLFTHRADVLEAARHVVDAWESVFTRMYDLILSEGAGVTQWVACWADTPFTVPTCDFNALIGPTDFREICLPSLAEQARRAGLCVFHLDGPEAARHAQSLAEDPDITAIQYTPGAGTPSALATLPMLQMLQAHGKPLFIEAPLSEVKALALRLNLSGTALRVSDSLSPEDADALIDWRDKTFA